MRVLDAALQASGGVVLVAVDVSQSVGDEDLPPRAVVGVLGDQIVFVETATKNLNQPKWSTFNITF